MQLLTCTCIYWYLHVKIFWKEKDNVSLVMKLEPLNTCTMQVKGIFINVFSLFNKFYPFLSKAAIRKELNEFKSKEMAVHEESKHLTRYLLIFSGVKFQVFNIFLKPIKKKKHMLQRYFICIYLNLSFLVSDFIGLDSSYSDIFFCLFLSGSRGPQTLLF